MARLGRLLGAAIGFAVGGPAGAAVGFGIGHGSDEKRRAKKEASAIEADQRNAYERQQNAVRAESARINAQLEASKNKVAQGVARASRSRIRGGIFGENAPAENLSERLG